MAIPIMEDVSPLPLIDLVRRRLIGVEKLVPAVLVGDDPDDVHDLRVATRRLQQSLVVLFAEPRPQRLRAIRRRVRRLRRALGEWRNCDVLLEIVDRRKRRARSEPRRRLFALLDTDLAARRQREIRRARRSILRLEMAKLGDEITQLVEQTLPDSLARPAASLEASIHEGWDEWRTSLGRAADTRTAEDVHALRISGKRLRYRIELAVELGGDTWKPSLAWLKQLQERLGEWQDRQVLYVAMARALSRPTVFLESSSAVRLALAEIEADRRRDAEDLRALFERAAEVPLPQPVETATT